MGLRRLQITSQEGQAGAEYTGAVLLVAALLGALLTVAGPALPGGMLAREVASKLVCAVKVAGPCGEEAAAIAARPEPIVERYGAELAAMIEGRAPTLSFEQDDFISLPVDFRECRSRTCADTIRSGSVQHTQTGLEPTVFTHVIDCRDQEAAATEGYDCSGERAGKVYLQYWLYYPDSATRAFRRFGYHADDWESYGVRVDPETGEAVARASSHHGYNGRGPSSINDTGFTEGEPGWDTILGELHVAAGSHAGESQNQSADTRWLKPSNLQFVPLEPIAKAGDALRFGDSDHDISPPWEKDVWTDPEATGT